MFQAEQLIAQLGAEKRDSQYIQKYIVLGTDTSIKIQLATKLSNASRPSSFDQAFGVAHLGSQYAQALVLGKTPAFYATAQKLFRQFPKTTSLVITLSGTDLCESIEQLKQWLKIFRQLFDAGDRKNTCQNANGLLSTFFILTDVQEFSKKENQHRKIAISYIRALALSCRAGFISVSSTEQMLEAANMIALTNKQLLQLQSAKNIKEKQPETDFVDVENAQSIYEVDEIKLRWKIGLQSDKAEMIFPECDAQNLLKKTDELYMTALYQKQKVQQPLTKLEDYLKYVEQTSKCGSDFDYLLK